MNQPQVYLGDGGKTKQALNGRQEMSRLSPVFVAAVLSAASGPDPDYPRTTDWNASKKQKTHNKANSVP